MYGRSARLMELDIKVLDADTQVNIQYTRCINYIDRKGYSQDGFSAFLDVINFEVSSYVESKNISRCIRNAKEEAQYAFEDENLAYLARKLVNLLIKREAAKNEREEEGE